MKTKSLAVIATLVFVAGCSTTGPRSTVKPPPFECTSIHPEVCELEEQFHLLRFEQADQIAAIDQAERRRKAAVAASAAATEYPDPATTERQPRRAPL